MRWMVIATLALSPVACVKSNAFKCDGDNSCSGEGGRCEADGFCSVPAASCSSGFQYSDTAGDLAGTCVGGGQPTDGPPTDTPSDGPQLGCNADFTTLANGSANHKYKLITTADDWVTQQDTVCVATNKGYLAVPDSAAELTALFGLAGSVDIWVGISDRAVEGEYREVLNNTVYIALPIDDNGPAGQNCIGSKTGTTLEDDDCNDARVVVCECNEP